MKIDIRTEAETILATGAVLTLAAMILSAVINIAAALKMVLTAS